MRAGVCKTSENVTCEFVIARRTRVLIARLTLTNAIVGKHVRAAHPPLLLGDGGDGTREEEEGGAASVVAGVDCCSEVVRYVGMFPLLFPPPPPPRLPSSLFGCLISLHISRTYSPTFQLTAISVYTTLLLQCAKNHLL